MRRTAVLAAGAAAARRPARGSDRVWPLDECHGRAGRGTGRRSAWGRRPRDPLPWWARRIRGGHHKPRAVRGRAAGVAGVAAGGRHPGDRGGSPRGARHRRRAEGGEDSVAATDRRARGGVCERGAARGRRSRGRGAGCSRQARPRGACRPAARAALAGRRGGKCQCRKEQPRQCVGGPRQSHCVTRAGHHPRPAGNACRPRWLGGGSGRHGRAAGGRRERRGDRRRACRHHPGGRRE